VACLRNSEGFICLQRDLLEDRLDQISITIDKYEAAHLSSQSQEQLDQAIEELLNLNILLQKVTDEEQLVER
jgi:hypothetical protein